MQRRGVVQMAITTGELYYQLLAVGFNHPVSNFVVP
jgi:hypothetical protein